MYMNQLPSGEINIHYPNEGTLRGEEQFISL